MSTQRIVEYLKKTRRVNDNDLEELILDGLKLKSFTAEDTKTLEKYSSSLISLSMNQCLLSSLSGLPKFPKLQSLELHDNKLGGVHVFEDIVEACPELDTLYMAGNKVAALDELVPLKSLSKLKEIDLEMNPIMTAHPREDIYRVVQQLEIVNGYTYDGKEVEEEKSNDEEGGTEDMDKDSSSPDNQGPHMSLLASLIHGKFEDDEEDLEDYNPESDELDSEDSMMESEGEEDEGDDEEYAKNGGNERESSIEER